MATSPLLCISSHDDQYKAEQQVYATIETVNFAGTPTNRLSIYEGKKGSKGGNLGHILHKDLYSKYVKRRDQNVKELILGHKKLGNDDYVVGGKITFSSDYAPEKLVIYLKTRGGGEMKEESIDFPLEKLRFCEKDTFNFKDEVKKVEGLVTYLEGFDAFYGDKVVVASIKNGKFGSPQTRIMRDSKVRFVVGVFFFIYCFFLVVGGL